MVVASSFCAVFSRRFVSVSFCALVFLEMPLKMPVFIRAMLSSSSLMSLTLLDRRLVSMSLRSSISFAAVAYSCSICFRRVLSSERFLMASLLWASLNRVFSKSSSTFESIWACSFVNCSSTVTVGCD